MAKKRYTKGSVTSQDGTTIGYRKMGSGPGLILMHGGAMASQHFMMLGEALEDIFTVYIPDRRGRGMSGSFGDNYGMKSEIDDLRALNKKTEAHYIFGLSSGGLIAMEATRKLPTIQKAALYEPPLDIDGSIMRLLSFMTRFDSEIAKNQVSEATVTMLRDFGLLFGVPSWLAGLPRPVLVSAFKLYYTLDQKITKEDNVPYFKLIPTFHYDYELVREMQGKLENYKHVQAEILLLGGSKSPQFLKNTFNALEGTLPNVKRVELQGLNHSGSLESGDPERVAQELKNFYLN